MVIHDVASLPSQGSFDTIFLKLCDEVKATKPPHVLELWLMVSKGMLPVKYLRSNKTCLMSVDCHEDHKMVTRLRYVWPPSVLGCYQI